MFRRISHFLTIAGAIAVVGVAFAGAAAASPAAASNTSARATMTATAAITVAPAKPPRAPAPRLIRLHRAYVKALPHTKVGKPAGIAYARGRQPRPATRRAAASGCTEPNCPMPYNGGAVQYHPHVYLLLWGPGWTTSSSEFASYSYLSRFYSGLGVQPQDAWSRTMESYTDSSGNGPGFGGSVYMGAWQDPSTPPSGANTVQIGAEAAVFAANIGINDVGDAQVVVATQSGTCPSDFPCFGGPGNECAYHDATGLLTGVPFTSLPYVLDAGGDCTDGSNYGADDAFSVTGGHEYAETVTDPYPPTGWYDLNNGDQGEIGDKCDGHTGTITLSTGTFAVQDLYSNDAYDATGTGCTLGWPDNVAVTSPGSQSSPAHAPASLQIQASGSAGYPLGYTAAGLPPGLSANYSTGLISGSPTSTGTYQVTLYASDITGASASASFTWTITGSGDTVAVTSPGRVTSIVYLATSEQIHATSSGGNPLTYTAAGLPPGLSINASTGVISGTVRVAGTWSVTVTASDKTGDSASATFTWTVKTLGPPCTGRQNICNG
jgi:Putative Ig domain